MTSVYHQPSGEDNQKTAEEILYIHGCHHRQHHIYMPHMQQSLWIQDRTVEPSKISPLKEWTYNKQWECMKQLQTQAVFLFKPNYNEKEIFSIVDIMSVFTVKSLQSSDNTYLYVLLKIKAMRCSTFTCLQYFKPRMSTIILWLSTSAKKAE